MKPENSEASSFRLIAAMAVAGTLSGLALVGVYLWTLPMIQRNQAAALERAVFKVLPGTASFEPESTEDGITVYRGVDANQQSTGYAIPAEGPGYADTIKVLYGLKDESVIVGLEVLESRETPGLGDKIIFDEAFHANFKSLRATPEIKLVKQGEKSQPNEVEGISGATISSKAVVKMLNKSVSRRLAKRADNQGKGAP